MREMRRLRVLVDEGILPPVDGFILNKDYFRIYIRCSSVYSLVFTFPQQGNQRLSSSPPLS